MFRQSTHTPICAQSCKISPEVYVISPDKVPIKGKSYISAFSHGISTPISHQHTKPAHLFHSIFLSVLSGIHMSDWDWGTMKPYAAILFAEDSRQSFQSYSGFTITVKDTISAFLSGMERKSCHTSLCKWLFLPLDSRELYFLYVLAKIIYTLFIYYLAPCSPSPAVFYCYQENICRYWWVLVIHSYQSTAAYTI